MKKRNLKSLKLNKKSISKLALSTHGGYKQADTGLETYRPQCSYDICYTDDCYE